MLTTTAIVAAALVVAVPAAFGLQRIVVDFLSAEPAPEDVQLDIARLDLGAPTGMATGVIAGQTRKVPVRSADGSETFVWVAPTRAGGFCFLWAHFVAGCRTQSSGGVEASFSASRLKGGAVEIGTIAGSTMLEDARRLELRFQDGDAIELPAAEGHVLGEIPARHYPPGRRLTLVIARDAAGAEVGRKRYDPTTHGTYPCAPADELDLGLGVTTCP